MIRENCDRMRVLLLVLLASLHSLGLCSESPARVDAAEIQAELDQLRSEIDKFTQLLDETKSERSSIESELKQNEKGISELIKKIQALKEQLNKGREKISALQQRQRELLLAKSEQQQYVVRQIRAAYQIGSQEYLKVLLNQENPNQIARMLKYYDYLNRARAQQIEQYSATIAELEAVEREIEKGTEQLVKDRSLLRTRHLALAGIKKEREQTLLRLNATIIGKDAELKILIGDRERLKALLLRIDRDIASLPAPSEVLPFDRLKGSMALPVEGRISNRFGSTLNKGKLNWNGLFITATEGTPVYAIHYGRVVFSDWLRGFGLLLIINHGEGYMSLYGHNQALYREIGDWVAAGEIIASIGNSGGFAESGLYFEIRYEGKPRDPQIWCVARA